MSFRILGRLSCYGLFFEAGKFCFQFIGNGLSDVALDLENIR